MNTILCICYILSVVYCMWRIIKRYKYSSHDGVIGPTPGLDIIAVLILAPILTVVDLIVTIINKYFKRKYE